MPLFCRKMTHAFIVVVVVAPIAMAVAAAVAVVVDFDVDVSVVGIFSVFLRYVCSMKEGLIPVGDG